jgi:sarcosine oxidase subunit beta
MTDFDVIIIGAGIAGSSAAFHLAENSSLKILLIDKNNVSSGASGLNAGHISSTGLGNNPDMQSYLTHGSLEIFKSFQIDRGYDIEFRQSGSLSVIQTEEQYKFNLTNVLSLKSKDLNVDLISAKQAKSIEPDINDNMEGYIYYPLRAQADPVKSTNAFAKEAIKLGAKLKTNEEVTNILYKNDNTYEIITKNNQYSSNKLIIATGAWSNKLFQSLELDIPIIPVRGQMWSSKSLPPSIFTAISATQSSYDWSIKNTDDENNPPDLTHIKGERITRHLYGRQRKNGEIIFGGDRENVGFTDKLDFNGIESNKNHVSELFPFISRIEIDRAWSGFMPFSIDGKPIIGKIPRYKNLYIVSGLASSGFGRGPMAGKYISEIVLTDHSPNILKDAEPSRFDQLN